MTIQSRPVYQNFPTNKQVFGNPVNVFSRENSHKPVERPTPMSTTSRIPSLQTKNMQRPPFRQNANYNHFQNVQRNPNVLFTELTYLADGTPIYSQNEDPENYYTEEQYPENLEHAEYYFDPDNSEETQNNPTENENFPNFAQTTSPP